MKNVVRNGTIVRLRENQVTSRDTFVPKKYKVYRPGQDPLYVSTKGLTPVKLDEILADGENQ